MCKCASLHSNVGYVRVAGLSMHALEEKKCEYEGELLVVVMYPPSILSPIFLYFSRWGMCLKSVERSIRRWCWRWMVEFLAPFPFLSSRLSHIYNIVWFFRSRDKSIHNATFPARYHRGTSHLEPRSRFHRSRYPKLRRRRRYGMQELPLWSVHEQGHLRAWEQAEHDFEMLHRGDWNCRGYVSSFF